MLLLAVCCGSVVYFERNDEYKMSVRTCAMAIERQWAPFLANHHILLYSYYGSNTRRAYHAEYDGHRIRRGCTQFTTFSIAADAAAAAAAQHTNDDDVQYRDEWITILRYVLRVRYERSIYT